jgi:hypothetical protein
MVVSRDMGNLSAMDDLGTAIHEMLISWAKKFSPGLGLEL